MLVRDVMTRPAVSVHPSTPVRAAAALLTEHGFTALPVLGDTGDLVGIVTEHDLLRGRIRHDARSPLLGAELAAGPAPATVGDVMTTPVETVVSDADVADLVERMERLGIRAVPVVGRDRGDGVVGIVSRRDVVETLTRADAAIATDVRHHLETYAGPGRWRVGVDAGVVTLTDLFDDAVEAHVATVIAARVAGVVDVRIAPAVCRPEAAS